MRQTRFLFLALPLCIVVLGVEGSASAQVGLQVATAGTGVDTSAKTGTAYISNGIWSVPASQYQTFNVFTYGATCTGAGGTDDTSAVQAAITAAVSAGGGDVVGSGVCLVSNLTLALPGDYQPVNFRGLGGLWEIQQRMGASGTLLAVTAAGQYAAGLDWRDVFFHGGNNSNTIVSLPAIYDVQFYNVLIGYTSAIGVQLNGTEVTRFYNTRVQNAATCVNAVASGGYSPNAVEWFGGRLSTCSTRAMAVDHAYGWSAYGTLFSSNGTVGNLSTGTVKFTTPSADASIGEYFACYSCQFELDNGNSEFEATASYSDATAAFYGSFFLSGNAATGPPNSVYVNGGRLTMVNSQMPCAGCGAGHYYTLTTTGTQSSMILNSQASFASLDAQTATFPWPTTGATASGVFPALYSLTLNNGTFTSQTLAYDASGNLKVTAPTGQAIIFQNTIAYSGPYAIPYSASMTPDLSKGNYFTITPTNNSGFTINNPINVNGYPEMTLEIHNTAGGTLGAISWGAAYVLAGASFTPPANRYSRIITFRYTGNLWREVSRTSADE